MLTNQVGDAVYIRGPMNGAYKVDKADVTSQTKMPAIGIIIRKWGFTDCQVQLWGEVRNIYSGLTPGRRYFVGPDGRPALPEDFSDPSVGQKHRIQTLAIALDVGVLLLKPADDFVVMVG